LRRCPCWLRPSRCRAWRAPARLKHSGYGKVLAQRGTWYGNNIQTNTDYHILYKTKVEKEQTITTSCTSGCIAKFDSLTVGEYNFGSMDGQIQTFMKNISDANPGILPVFISYDICLTSCGC